MNDQQQPVFFPDNLDSMFEQYLPESTLPFRELPLGDYHIMSERTFTTKDKRDCLVLTLVSRNDQTKFTVYAPDRLRDVLLPQPNVFTYLRNLGLKTSKSTGNQYFDFQLA